jgi:hypothetical protein
MQKDSTMAAGPSAAVVDALSAAAGADGFGGDADDLAELADDHEFAGLVDEVDARDRADPGGGIPVDDAIAAAGPVAVLVDVVHLP